MRRSGSPWTTAPRAGTDGMLMDPSWWFSSNYDPDDPEYFTWDDALFYASYFADSYDATDNPQRVMALVFNIVDDAYCDPDYPVYAAGYFWPTMNEYYADRNIIHIDSADWESGIGPDAATPHLYEQVFTHEYQHAIHFDHDADEATWVNEGLSDLAPFLVGYGHLAGHLAYYLVYHRTSLVAWNQTIEDYGAAYLFQLYLLENFGGPAFIRALVDEPGNGIEGVESQLAAFGCGARFDDIYRDWTVANLIDEPSLSGISGARLGYEELDIGSSDTWGYTIPWSAENVYGSGALEATPLPRVRGGFGHGSTEPPTGEVVPYAPHYTTYGSVGHSMNVHFSADGSSGTPAWSGSYQLFGGSGDLRENQAVTASPVPLGPGATLSFMTTFEIEPAWDFAFVQVSVDGGASWTSLANEATTTEHDPNAIQAAVDNLPGLTGSSSGWVEMVFDLSAYEGLSVLVRFLYVTDWATCLDGIYIDDVVIADASGTVFSDDLETADAFVLGGFEHTTGLTENGWSLTYVQPIYADGALSGHEIEDETLRTRGDVQTGHRTLDTHDVGEGEVTLIVSNRLPEGMEASAAFTTTVVSGWSGRR